ncbi:hypothetical protein HYPSUDRAFT_209627 [Hypholoma sublateritium FD-334 SS-4]|uniref:Uncharacterized protein n=1 Tax=Hypholoma sublateritium (strain FD-334 SS-4) TaxID=945553 RepID=A0A0D2N9L0_HYPSF|nr:hypothetical protein HYPSUDRAFT_209627 [Hypholoma sublateritium FD-334 SS-4]
MLVADPEPNDNDSDPLDNNAVHPYLYGRVIGIYHVNIVYTGPGMKGYEAMRFDFLHVRWFQLDLVQPRGRSNCAWTSLHLDRLSFPPMAGRASLGFVDPSLILRGCHLIPAYSLGKARSDGIGISKMLKDAKDWKYYYVNRFADRDMTMRYHWGMGIGHIYSHGRDINSNQNLTPASDDNSDQEEDELTPASGHMTAITGALHDGDQSDDSDKSESEKELEDDEDVDYDKSTTDSDEDSDGDSSLELYETYH